ncbi:MAG TPA: glycosyltransferase, partial [Thermoanaerobaculia bacterium]|nr:glycosyltransferase [Thermoanaerobaculia bacterium]
TLMAAERSLVSTLIPVYNRPAMLREAVASVLAQTYRPIEIVIVDDGSTDETGEVAEALARAHPEIRVAHQANAGSGAARETARRLARGAFLQHLDSDDLLEPRKFEWQVAGLEAHPECGASYGWTRMRFPDGRTSAEPWKRSGDGIETMFPAMLQSRWWDTPCPLYRASVTVPWLPLRMEEDWEFDAHVASRGVRLHHVGTWVCEVRAQASGYLSGRGHEPELLRDRAAAHAHIYEHARSAGIRDEQPEMRHFARELFLLARQCGAAGLIDESRRLFALAREASGPERNRPSLRAYAALARVAGWRTAGALAAFSDKLRRRP